jgi:hypothetical protein
VSAPITEEYNRCSGGPPLTFLPIRSTWKPFLRHFFINRKDGNCLSPPGIAETHPSMGELLFNDWNRVAWVPVDKIRYFSGVSFTREQHHFCRYLGDGEPSLAKFYSVHQPRDQFELNFLDQDQSGKFRTVAPPLIRTPWSANAILHGGRKHHLSIDNGHQGFGPVQDVRIRWEARRLERIRKSIIKSGLRPHLSLSEPLPQFQLLVNDEVANSSDYRVMVTAGNHRVAVLAHLGWKSIPMMRSPSAPVIRRSDLNYWPGVLDQTYSNQAAGTYFLSFFRDNHQVLLPEW